MLILTLRTDKPTAEIGLYDDMRQLAYHTWEAHRALAETLHGVIREQIEGSGNTIGDIGGIVVYQGPGSFTGLRIGASVANALARGLDASLVGEQGDGPWLETGLQRLLAGENDQLVIPEYGAPVHITAPRK